MHARSSVDGNPINAQFNPRFVVLKCQTGMIFNFDVETFDAIYLQKFAQLPDFKSYFQSDQQLEARLFIQWRQA
jgi:hypothetical protein